VPKGAGLLDFIHSPSRLTHPQYRAPGSDRWQPISWDDALDRIAKLMKQDRDANFVAKTPEGLTVNRWLTTGMLAASPAATSRLSHAQGRPQPRHPFIRQPSACVTRPDGGRSCPDVWPWSDDESLGRHQECRHRSHHGRQRRRAHPCGFKWVTEAKAHNKARLIVVDPRFTRSASVADVYVPIRTGTDIRLLGGVINHLLSEDKIQHEYVRSYTDLSFIVREDFAFATDCIRATTLRNAATTIDVDYEIGPDGYVKADPALAHPRCVYS